MTNPNAPSLFFFVKKKKKKRLHFAWDCVCVFFFFFSFLQNHIFHLIIHMECNTKRFLHRKVCLLKTESCKQNIHKNQLLYGANLKTEVQIELIDLVKRNPYIFKMLCSLKLSSSNNTFTGFNIFKFCNSKMKLMTVVSAFLSFCKQSSFVFGYLLLFILRLDVLF